METYREKIVEFEHQSQEHSLPSGEKQPVLTEKSVEAAPALTPAEALQNVAEAVESSVGSVDAHDRLQSLQQAENEPQTATPSMVTSQMKQVAQRQGLNRVQHRETTTVRSFSKLIHQPAVRVVSEAAGKTLTRPSGLLGGGLVAFLGSSSYLALAKYLGFTYNYSVSLALFAGGFIIGLSIELFVHFVTASRHQAD